MNNTNIIAMTLAGLFALSASAGEDSKPTAGGEPCSILRDINMFTPEEAAPAFKHKANDKWGTQWTLDAAWGYWSTHRALPGTRHKNNYALLHAQVNQRLFSNEGRGGTWLRAEFSGSWALDAATRRADRGGFDFASGIEGGTGGHADVYGSNGFFIPELALMHYFAEGKACLIAGMVNLTNYFDAVGIANDSFSHFVNTGFVNSCILPLTDSNLGAVIQYAPDERNYLMAAISRSDAAMGDNPFRPAGSGYALVGEYGHRFADERTTLRLTPFYQSVDESDGRHDRVGLSAGIEYSPCDRLSTYARAGLATRQALGGTFEFSCGAQWQPFTGREDDFVGISWGIFKHRNAREYGEPTAHHREQVLELMYSWQLCEHAKVVPHIQYIHNPAYRSDTNDAALIGVQTVFSF